MLAYDDDDDDDNDADDDRNYLSFLKTRNPLIIKPNYSITYHSVNYNWCFCFHITGS